MSNDNNALLQTEPRGPAQQKKVRRPRTNDAPKAARCDQLAAGAVIDCNWSMTAPAAS